MKKLKLSIGVQDFPKMIEEGYRYVDKTDLVYKMANEGAAYFLSRPRRFGKSLLCSTLGAYFEGRKELFKGLMIEELEEDWKAYPVIRIDLNAEKYESIESLHQILEKNLRYFEELYGKKEGFDSYASRFYAVIRSASEKSKSKVVILIDEYDKALNATLHVAEVHSAIKSELKAFYEVLKSADEYLRFTFITGVSKFSQVSLFSSLNHLKDMSLDEEYATICGLTENELFGAYSEEILNFAQKRKLTVEQTQEEFKKWYNGYRFHYDAQGVYNPFSTIHALTDKEFKDFWFSTATPTFLIQYIERFEFPVPKLESVEADASEMMKLDIDGNHLIALLYQTGYLTIESYDSNLRMYKLKIPNIEVKEGLYSNLLSYFGSYQKAEGGSYLIQMIKGLNSGDLERCMMGFKSYLSGIPTNLKMTKEAYYHTLFFTIFKVVGTRIQVEVLVDGGRADAIVQTSAGIFIFEFKYRKSAKAALQQIKDKGYHLPYVGLGQPLTLIGVNFANGKLDWVVEK